MSAKSLSSKRIFSSSLCVSNTLYFGLFLILIPLSVSAAERVYRIYNQSSGLPVASLSGYAQDTNGFFWVSTTEGLFRFDGTEFRQWAKDKFSGSHYMIYPAPDGEVFVFDITHTLYHILPNEDAEPVIGPEGSAFTNVHDVAFTKDKRFWVARQNALFYLSKQSEWRAMPREIPGNEKIWKLSASFDGSLYVVTTHNIWKINPDFSYDKILARRFDGYIGSAIAHPDGSIFFMEKHSDGGKILELRDGQVTELISPKTNLQGFVLRGQTVWANSDDSLIAFREGKEPEVLRVPDNIPGSGMMVVDNEGSLWFGTSKGLIQFPEPETVIFNERDGLVSSGTRYLVKTKEGIWVVTWGWGISLFKQKNKKWHINDYPPKLGWLGVDGEGTLWGHADYQYFFRRMNGKFIKLLPPAPGNLGEWFQAPDGRVWMTSDRGLWRTQLNGESPRFLGNPLGNGTEIENILEDSEGRLWITNGERIGYVLADAVASGEKVSCSWQTLNGTRKLGRIIELPNGSIWVGTQDKGVWRYTDETGWEPIPASQKFASKNLGGLVLSPSGGVWVLGLSACIRVIDRPDLPDGWQVIEELSDWQGVPSRIIDLIEETDGSIWGASATGVVHLSAEARRTRTEPPRVRLVDFVVNGERVALNSSLQIPPGNNQLEIHFAALTYRDRSLLKFQYRLHNDDEWIDSSSKECVFRFYNLRAGKYTIEVRASLDGVNWSGNAAQINFEVLPHWYQRWWAIAAFVLVLAFALYIAYRVRLTMLLSLERQRTQIAMDLHDEIGSGLGSIGILSSVASSQNIAEDQRQELTTRIAETAGELGASLTDIVWSLRSDVTTLESLAYHLTRRAESLFANDAPRFTTKFPDNWQAVNLSLAARHNILLIAMESMHNAAKHAQSANVTLRFLPTDGRNWLMQIEDDGCGLHNSTSNNSSGLGMQSMKRRAAEIGAEINWTSNKGHGTIVSLKFNPNAKERGLKLTS